MSSSPVGRDMSGRVVVFLHAHPDDEAIFTGATMHRLVDRGARVVLVTATGGEEGSGRGARRGGERLRRRRLGELESACTELGVARLELLHFRDSGMPGARVNSHPRAFARQEVPDAGRRLVQLLVEEGAESLVHYDAHGIYGHPDHVAVHRLGAWAAARAGAASYEATVDREQLRSTPRHLVQLARPRGSREPLGLGPGEITLTLVATAHEVLRKSRAMAAHVSQIPPSVTTDAEFPATYGREWFVRRRGQAGSLEQICSATTGWAPADRYASAARQASA